MSNFTPITLKTRPRFFEDNECKALWRWALMVPTLRDYLYHVPNGGSRNKIEAARMKGMGVRAGVFDYHLPVPRGEYHGLWIEMKATPPNDARVSPEQKEWLAKMQAQGYAAYVCRGWGEAQRVFQWYLGLPVPEIAITCPPLEAVLGEVGE